MEYPIFIIAIFYRIMCIRFIQYSYSPSYIRDQSVALVTVTLETGII